MLVSDKPFKSFQDDSVVPDCLIFNNLTGSSDNFLWHFIYYLMKVFQWGNLFLFFFLCFFTFDFVNSLFESRNDTIFFDCASLLYLSFVICKIIGINHS